MPTPSDPTADEIVLGDCLEVLPRYADGAFQLLGLGGLRSHQRPPRASTHGALAATAIQGAHPLLRRQASAQQALPRHGPQPPEDLAGALWTFAAHEVASERFHAAIEDGLAERPARYPHGAAFVGADMSDLGNVLARNAREGRAIVLVYPDGEERVVEPHEPASAPKAA